MPVTTSIMAQRHTLTRPLLVAVSLVLLLVAWLAHDYRLALPPRADDLNRGRTWEHKARIDGKGVEQVWVPPGCFEMGSDPLHDFRARANESPRLTVCITSGFWIDRFEVTNTSFAEFTSEGGFGKRQYWSDEGWRVHETFRRPYPMLRAFDDPRQPRVKITWYEAEAYAAWRGGKLPTEAQWEWAARGPGSRRYPWGEKFLDGAANMDRLELHCTRPVGSYPSGRSWCGAEDMAGNVWEWTADGYDPYAYRREAHRVTPVFDPFTPPAGPLRVIRGGAWGGMPGGSIGDLRSARRVAWNAADRKLSQGARIVHPGP